MTNVKKVAIIGLGYIGLPTFVAVLKTGQYDVIGYTRTKKRADLINKGISPIEDKDVNNYLKKNKVKITNKDEDLKNSDIFILCVPTCLKGNNPDYTALISVTKLVAKYIRKGSHYVLESTVSPGTCEKIIIPILENTSRLEAGKDFNVAHCPERINPGDTKWNIYNINRNIGSVNKRFNKEIARFYRTFISDARINEVSSLKVAEASKVVENTFRDINIAFVNELAQSFDRLNIDLIETLNAASNKPFAFLKHQPGCGVGGNCIAINPYYLIKASDDTGFDLKLTKSARKINNYMPYYVVHKLCTVLNSIGLSVKDTKIAILGLAYKPGVSDFRGSPALVIEKELKKLGAVTKIYDPIVPGAEKDQRKTIEDVQAIVITTSHKQIIQGLPPLLSKTKVRVIIDGRNCLDKEKIIKLGIIYKGIGR